MAPDQAATTSFAQGDFSQEALVAPGHSANLGNGYADTSTEHEKPNWFEQLLLTRDLWSQTWNIYLFWVAGVAFAIGHHAYYASLEDKIVHGDDQLLKLRYGTILAFAAKASFGASVLTAFRQQVWATVRSKLLAIATLDDIFAAHETPFSLLNLEFLARAKLVASLALFGWLSPLIVILTTNTLLVKPTQEVQQTRCSGVRTLNFSHEGENDWRHTPKIEGLWEISLSEWNVTRENTSEPYFFDYWAMRSVWGDQMFSATTALQRPYTNLDDTFVVCEKGWNCTVEIKFVAPAYKCQEQARGVGAQIRSLQQESGEAHSPIDFNLLAPIGSYTYISNAGLGHYSNTQLKAVNLGGIPLMNPPFPENLGAFRTDPVVWVGYSEIVDSSVPPFLQENQTFPFNRKAWEPVLVACEHYEADYTVELRYIDGMQPHRIKERKLLSPTINTTFMEGATANDGTDDDTLAVPESNYIFPTDVKRYKRTAAG
ncbi:hypothetical protein CGCS363_v008082 [Colletotrichum siamense]|uniref:uncharacterized protein n=1 Tax=Colletotrichum siamense TaxID=690259 RepID=UPI00187297A5|nr:uncharacterized protein CGCS363_v008082 [Colletotrichum siamense]KAF5497650.1 hypothetical protein CGCS363_v008082 [Colletotrichum siamense]